MYHYAPRPEDLEAIVLVGGATLMPMVAERLEKEFGKRPYQELSPHTAVAQGAASRAGSGISVLRRGPVNGSVLHCCSTIGT